MFFCTSTILFVLQLRYFNRRIPIEIQKFLMTNRNKYNLLLRIIVHIFSIFILLIEYTLIKKNKKQIICSTNLTQLTQIFVSSVFTNNRCVTGIFRARNRTPLLWQTIRAASIVKWHKWISIRPINLGPINSQWGVEWVRGPCLIQYRYIAGFSKERTITMFLYIYLLYILYIYIRRVYIE